MTNFLRILIIHSPKLISTAVTVIHLLILSYSSAQLIQFLSRAHTHRDSPLPKVIALHLELFILLKGAIEEDNDVHFGRLKGIHE